MRGGRRNGRIANVVPLLAVASAATLLLAIPASNASSHDASATAIADGLRTFSDRLEQTDDALGDFQALAESLPLTSLAPGGDEALRMSRLFREQVGDKLAATYASLDELASDIESFDDTGAVNGVLGQFGDVTHTSSGTFVDFTIPFSATRTVAVPLDFDADVDGAGGTSQLVVDRGSLSFQFEVSTSLTLRLNTALLTTAPAEAISILGTPQMNLCARADASIASFLVRFGFTDVSISTDDPATPATETAKVNACARVQFSDPDSDGVITQAEWASHSLTELMTASLVDGTAAGGVPAPDVAARFYANASLIPGNPDATLEFTDANLAAAPAMAVTPTFAVLDDFDNITPTEVAQGLAQFAGAIAGAQTAGNGPLPFLEDGLSKAFDAASPVVTYAKRLTDANVVCGTTPGAADADAPTGSTAFLLHGTTVYCRATTSLSVKTGTVAWTSTNATAGTNTGSPGSNDTIGATPSANAQFTLNCPGGAGTTCSFKGQVAFTVDDPDGTGPLGETQHVAIPKPATAEELFAELLSAAGLSSALSSLAFDPGTRSLTFRLVEDDHDFAPVTVGVDFGDKLRGATNLGGLESDLVAHTGATLTAENLAFDLTFGVILVPSLGDISPGATGDNPTSDVDDAPELLDRFFVKTDPGASEPEVALGTLAADVTVDLSGRIGFLEVGAGGSAAKNPAADGNAFSLGKADPTKPVVRVDVNAPNAPLDVNVGGTPVPIANAIGIEDLLFHLDSAHLAAACNLKMSAGLGVSASVDGATLASGGVSVNWPTVFNASSCTPNTGALSVVADGEFNASLKNFDPFPEVEGTATGGDADTLIDSAANFVAKGNLSDLTLRNKTTGATCHILTFSATDINCVSNFAGGSRPSSPSTANQFVAGDQYVVEGNAFGMLHLILDRLDELVDQLDALGVNVDAQLPLADVSTRDLVAKIRELKRTIDDLRGFPAATIKCGLNAPNMEHADPWDGPGENVAVVPDGTTVHCNARSVETYTSAKWEQTLGGSATLDQPSSPTTVGPNPGGTFSFTVNDPNVAGDDAFTTIDEWQVKLTFANAGGSHTTWFPVRQPPQSLQDLEALVESNLGVGDILDLNLLDLPDPGQAPKKSGTAGTITGNVLTDSGADFDGNGVEIGMLLVNKTENERCTITARDNDTVTCGAGMSAAWTAGDTYDVVGDGTKDLVIDLHTGFCAQGSSLCESTDVRGPALNVPLELPFTGPQTLVSVSTAGELSLEYGVRASLELGIPLELGLPSVVVVDGTRAEAKAKLAATNLGLNANVGPIGVALGSLVTDLDSDTSTPEPETPAKTALLGAGVDIFRDGTDDGDGSQDFADGNQTYSLGSFFSLANVTAQLGGESQECVPASPGPGVSGDVCAALSIAVNPQSDPAFGYMGNVSITCDIPDVDLTSGAPTITCAEPTLPPLLSALIHGEPLNWSMLIQVLPRLLESLEQKLDGAAQNLKLPVVGNALDGGAQVVNTLRTQVVQPFANLSAQITATVDTAPNGDGDGIAEPDEVAKKVREFIWTEIGGAEPNVIHDLNGDGAETIEDIVVTAVCDTGPCVDGQPIEAIDDLRITFLLGQGYDVQLPFDLGLDGVPLRLQGNVGSAGSWGLMVDFGLSRDDGPYLVQSGKKTILETADTKHDGAADSKDLIDAGASFNTDAEIGMYVRNLTDGNGCVVTQVVSNTRLSCDVGSTADTEGLDWDVDDQYRVVRRHAPNLSAPANVGEEAEFTLTADATLRDFAAACAGDPGSPAPYNNSRCIRGEIGFLAVTVRDANPGDGSYTDTTPVGGDGTGAEDDLERTKVALTATIDIKRSSGSGAKITFADLVGNTTIVPGFQVTANVDVRIKTGFREDENAGLPSVVGAMHLFWGLQANTESGIPPGQLGNLQFVVDNLAIDLGAFITDFLGPIVKEVKNVTKPLMPVIETIQAPLPIISDLSVATGGDPISLLDIIEAVSGNDLSLLRSVIQFVQFANRLPADQNLVVPLGLLGAGGKFKLSGAAASAPTPTPDQQRSLQVVGGTRQNLIDGVSGATTAPADQRPGTFGVAGLTFPIFSDASNIFQVLMGKDVTLVRYDAGRLRAAAGVSYTFGPFMAGPIPVTITIGGSVELRGRFAIGYDTSGLRKVLEGGTGEHLLDGIFIDDLDASGNDVPEVQFIGTVFAEGAASIYIISVGVRGELIFTTNLDLDDRPNADGKLYIEEIINRLSNPICLFVVSGSLDAQLSAFVEIDLFFFTKRFTIVIVRVTLLKFEVKCEPEVPDLARVDGSRLILHAGPLSRRELRNVQETNENEKFTVRQMEEIDRGPPGDSPEDVVRFTISAFGIHEEEFLPAAAVDNGTARMDALGDNGNDNFTFVAGGDGGQSASTPVTATPFSVRVEANMGAGNDEIKTGDANDSVVLGPASTSEEDNDEASTGKGNDFVNGGDKDDSIDAGPGNDTDVRGGAGNDTISGGDGGDTVRGEAGDDNLGGAGGTPANDAADLLIGGPGSDILAGVTGNDTLRGDDDSTCAANTTNGSDPNDQVDSLDGGPGNDQLFGGPDRDQAVGGPDNPADLGSATDNDTVCGNNGNDEITGGLGKDTAEGGSGSDTIEGGKDLSPAASGGDVLSGGADADYVIGDLGAFNRPNPNAAPSITLDDSFAGSDTINGNDGADRIYGQAGNDTILAGAQNDVVRGGSGADTIQGGDHADTIWGDQSDLPAAACPGTSCDDLVYGSDANPTANPADAATAAAGADGSDTIRGGYGADEIYGDEASDFLFGDGGSDEIYGGLGTDDIRGNGDADVARGNENDDVVYGDSGDDHLEGNENDASALGDQIFGNADQDDILGGTDFAYDATPNADGGDTIQGNQAQDAIVGDNGQITRPGGDQVDGTHARSVTLEDPGNAGGADDIEGNEEDDDVYGGGGDDEINGNAGDDYVEGNGGADDIFGDGEQDDLIGGTSQGGGGVADAGADQIQGDAGHDVIAGDNASIARTGGGTCDGWTCNTFSGAVTGAVIRGVVLYDVGTATAAAPAGASDGDTIDGNDGHDRVYAGGGADTVHGDGGDDVVYGNDGGDQLFGDDGQDDLVGGTGRSDTSAATSAVDGRLDGADTIDGGADFDSIAGDNALVVRSTTGSGENAGLWVANTFNGAVTRTLVLLDVATASAPAAAGTSGNDLLLGQAADDTAYGQGGNDGLSGGDGNDYLEGNANGAGDAPKPDPADPAVVGDLIHGNGDSDDVAGGTGRIWTLGTAGAPVLDPAAGVDGRLDGADWIAGDAGADSIAGDNAVVERALTGAGAWILDDLRDPDALDVVRRIVRLRDVATAADAAPLSNGTSGGDTIAGNDGFDVAYGQGGDDAINGNDGDDVLAGNAGTDTIHGDAGQDDIAGGTGRTVSNDAASAVDGRTDANDTLYGDAGEDVVYGDNATIDRFPFDGAYAPTAPWQLDSPAAGRAENVVRRVTRALDVATTSFVPAAGSFGADTITGDDGYDVVYAQGGADDARGNAGDDHLEGNAGGDTLRGDGGQDDVIGGTGRVQSDDAASAVDGRLDGNDTISGGDGTGGVGSDDFDVLVGDNGTIDRTRGTSPAATQLPSNGEWATATWNASILRVVRLYDVSVSTAAAPDAGTAGDDSIRGEIDDDLVFGQGADDTIEGNLGDDYVEGNAAADRITGDLGEDDIVGGGSARTGVLDANRDGTLDADRSGETLRDGIDTIDGDSTDGAVGEGDVISGDNARIQRLLSATGAWRQDSQRGTRLRDVFLFDVEKVGGAGGFTADASESGPDMIWGNGGPDVLFGQDNGALADAHGAEGGGDGATNCQNAATGPGTGLPFAPVGDDDADQLPDLNDPQCRGLMPGDWVHGQGGGDYVEGNHGSDTVTGGEGEDDVVGGSSSNTGHVDATLPPADRAAGYSKTPELLLDGHDSIDGNAEDDAIAGDNAFVDRYVGAGGAWLTIAGGGRPADLPGSGTVQHPENAGYGPYALTRRDVTMRQTPDPAGAFGSDVMRAGTGHDDAYGQLGHDWIEGNEGEDAVVSDLGKIVNNLLGAGADTIADPPLNEPIRPAPPFLNDAADKAGVLKREVVLYAFNTALASPGIGHDVVLGGAGNDWVHTGPGEDLANGNAGDDRLFLGDSARATLAKQVPLKLAHDQVDAAWGGEGHDHVYGGYGADMLDIRPRTVDTAPGIVPGADPATWFQVAGPAVTGRPGDFEGVDWIYGGWDQDAMQADVADVGPKPGDRLMDWVGVYNAYYVCPAAYGEWVITRVLAPNMVSFLQELAQGDGASATVTSTSSGFRELGIVFNNQAKDNSNPIHPDTPAHFTCGTLSP